MGACFAPSYANLFVGYWEREYMLSYSSDASGPNVLSWMRFIDDVLIIWQGNRTELDGFLTYLNANDWNIKFTFKVEENKIDFLYLQLSVDQLGNIHSTIYRKETSTNSLLHAKSAHPRHTIKAFPKRQFIRARRICDSEEEFENQARDLKQRFLRRGYMPVDVERGYQQAKDRSRDSLLHYQIWGKEEPQLWMITNYHSRWRDMGDIMNRHWPILKEDPELAKLIEGTPRIVARRSKTISEMITHSHYIPPRLQFIFNSKGPAWGSRPCGGCSACRYMVKTDVFVSSSNSHTFKIVHPINCRTTSVVYHITCPCGLTYIGLTSRQLHVRILEHIRDIRAARLIGFEDLHKEEVAKLKTIPSHYREFHPTGTIEMQVKGGGSQWSFDE
ncbi:unnamed protein product [Ranitomeya imitator]|uniref:Helix-turn-helix domain-containing protein n=1 Tax=Ranitomeya imitator TaxID=111125 RepID=A0ABN9LKJ4_9NEOB|nr:unnamed protein product [Ranitomeya imitator]